MRISDWSSDVCSSDLSALLPLGVPLWLDTTWPATDKPLRRLVVAQDVGSAIKGVVRGDFFWGSGEAALEQAGRMKQQGRYYLFLPKAVADRRQTARDRKSTRLNSSH